MTPMNGTGSSARARMWMLRHGTAAFGVDRSVGAIDDRQWSAWCRWLAFSKWVRARSGVVVWLSCSINVGIPADARIRTAAKRRRRAKKRGFTA